MNDDLISRQAAIDALYHVDEYNGRSVEAIRNLPSAQTEIIYCKDCKKHNKIHGRYYDGTFVGMMDCCPLAEIRGAAQGHEFDYQFCAYAERRGEQDE